MIDITNENILKNYKQVKNELKRYNSKLAKKEELIVLNKIDLVNEKLIKKIIKDFKKNVKCDVFTLSTLDKKSVSKFKSKLIKYAT